jgi:magnesium chelatase family protein
VSRVTSAVLRVRQVQPRTTTEAARMRVTAARAAASDRLAATPWTVNSEVPGSWLRGPSARLGPSTTAALDRALEKGGITMRGYDRVLRVAWSVADLAGADRPTTEHLGQALYLRKAMEA